MTVLEWGPVNSFPKPRASSFRIRRKLFTMINHWGISKFLSFYCSLEKKKEQPKQCLKHLTLGNLNLYFLTVKTNANIVTEKINARSSEMWTPASPLVACVPCRRRTRTPRNASPHGTSVETRTRHILSLSHAARRTFRGAACRPHQ